MDKTPPVAPDRPDSPDTAEESAPGSTVDAATPPLTARALATTLGVNERTVRRAISRGDLPATKFAGTFRITAGDAARYAARLTENPKQPVSPIAPLPAPQTPLVGRSAETAA